jgi:uncharacterized membrane protein
MSMQTTESGINPKTWTLIVWGLTITGYFTGGVTTIVGVIIAYLKRDELAGTPFESHMTSAIRTFWISLIGFLIGWVLVLAIIGFAIIAVVFVWHLFRTVRGLIRAIDDRPIEKPLGWF